MAQDRFYIFRVTVTDAAGRRRSSLVKTTSLRRDPGASLHGLHAALAELESTGILSTSTVSRPATIGPRQRARLERWPAVLPTLLEDAS